MNRNHLKTILFTALFLFCGWLAACASEDAEIFEQKYSDKDAIYLLDNLTLELKDDWSYTTRLHRRVKILKEEARGLGEIPFPYIKGSDSVKIIYAYTITPDGKKHRYSKIQDFQAYNDFPMYSDAMTKVITMPEVNVGSIMEFEVIITSTSPIKGAFWDSFDFDFNWPAQEANTIIILPNKFDVAYKEFNLTQKPKITEAPRTITYSWNMQDVAPAEKSEEYLPMPTPDSFSDAFEFSSIKGWADVSSWYYALVQKNLNVTDEITDAAQAACKGKAALKDKTRAILEYVQDNFRYVSMSFGKNSLEPHPTDEVWRNKYGDCKDLSLLCMAMLKAAGINSSAALFNNEYAMNDPKYDLPFPTLFDHVILLVEDKAGGDFYIDPLLDGYDVGEFPQAYQGAYTFIIDGQGGRFGKFPVFDEKRDSTKTVQKVELYEDGSALFENEHLWELDSSIDMRDTIKAMDKATEADFYRGLDASIVLDGQMIERRVEGLDKKYGPVKAYVKYKRMDAYPLDGNMMILDIVGYNRDSNFTKNERKNPIFYAHNSLDEEITTYKIPKGFVVSHLPADISLKMGFFEMKRECRRSGDAITVTEITRHKRSQYPKEDYAKFKEFFDKLPGKSQQRIVLKKKKSWQKKLSEIMTILRE